MFLMYLKRVNQFEQLYRQFPRCHIGNKRSEKAHALLSKIHQSAMYWYNKKGE